MTDVDVEQVDEPREEHLVLLTGEVDMFRADELRAIEQDFTNSGLADVMVDISGVSFMDSTGLSLFAALYQVCLQRGGKVTVRGAVPAVRRVFEIVNFDQIMTVE